ncbi:MAG: NAD(P)/FAD-dependent oxidoreductase [bacterium]
MLGQPNRSYDVIIAGASFAGLAVARALSSRSRVLVVDRQPLGEGVTSACAAPVGTVRVMGAETSIIQIHTALVIHTPGGSTTWPLPEPFCTFDYSRFCHAAAAGTRATFLQASVHGYDRRCVLTSEGSREGHLLVDATGPRAALAGHGRPRHVAFGLESEIPRRVDPGLHFYFVPEIRDGYAWAFPCGEHTRFGVISYRGRTKVLPALNRFMARFDARPGNVHGGFLATGWTSGAVRGVFTVGDAAGQCLPVSGEGIRTAVLAGTHCGELVQQVLDGALSETAAQTAYREFIAADRRRYRGLLAANVLLLKWPQHSLARAATALGRSRPRRWFFSHYLGIFGGATGAVAPAGRPSPAVASEHTQS